MKIAVDLDDVLIQFNKGFLDYHNKKYNTSFDMVSDRPFRYDEFLGISVEEVVVRVVDFYKSSEFMKLKPMDFSQESVNKLVKNNKLIILTSRPPDMRGLTEVWTKKYFGNVFEEIILTGQFDLSANKKEITKSAVCEEKDVSLFIDDAVHYIEEVSRIGVKCLLFDRPWNKSYDPPKNVKRVMNWKEIVDAVSGF